MRMRWKVRAVRNLINASVSDVKLRCIRNSDGRIGATHVNHMDELSVPEQQSVIWRMFDRTLALTVYQLSNITGRTND